MELTPSQKETVRHEFDRLCRMVLRGEAIDYDNHIAWRSKHETSLSWLSESQEGQLGVLDEYSCERFCFQVQGYTIPIRSEILANALVKLSEKKRDIILLAYFLDMTDQEIADKLDRPLIFPLPVQKGMAETKLPCTGRRGRKSPAAFPL